MKEDDLIIAIEELNRKCGSYLGVLSGLTALVLFLLFITLIMKYQREKRISIGEGAAFLVLLTVSIRILIHMASVVETFRSMSCSIFRGLPSWELSNVLGNDPLLLQTYMKDLEPAFAFRLMGIPISYGTVHKLTGSILVGILLTVMVPLLSL